MHREIEQAVAYDRSSAPKDCRVSGWLEEKDMESETMLLLTEFTYDLDRSNAQTFDVADSARSGLVNTVRFLRDPKTIGGHKHQDALAGLLGFISLGNCEV
ncbi:hypothetical protein F2Q69_00024620 [Brassica cretica]|uniref:SUN domain-containing protein n=1 Tax=Brassica cretica TaxID=69181 RepID=A0A8S9Q7R9_BRACR|nr:hypothetical protein F2Q69_00024620 [Brassica cretica]